MEIQKVLEKLEVLLREWGLSPNDWVLIANCALKLQGYNVKAREGHLNVMVNRDKLSWKASKFDTFPPKNSRQLREYQEWMRTTGFDTDLIPVGEEKLKKVDSASHTLPNGQNIEVITPLGELKELDEYLTHCTKEELGEEKGRYLLGFIKDYKRAAIERVDKQFAKICDAQLKKYAFLKRKKEKRIKKKIKELHGSPVYKGIVRGRVRVILDENKLHELRDGEVLVTQMTSAKFTAVINRVIAIITDHGGKLCHAVILAREFKIPCVVGTEVATEVLKSGEKVEVDANKGIVKIVEKEELRHV